MTQQLILMNCGPFLSAATKALYLMDLNLVPLIRFLMIPQILAMSSRLECSSVLHRTGNFLRIKKLVILRIFFPNILRSCAVPHDFAQDSRNYIINKLNFRSAFLAFYTGLYSFQICFLSILHRTLLFKRCAITVLRRINPGE